MRKVVAIFFASVFVIGFLLQQFPTEARKKREAAERRELEEAAKLRRLQRSFDESRRSPR